MKRWDALQFFYGSDAASPGRACRNINEQTAKAVFASLPQKKERQVMIDDDEEATTGPEWLAPFPPQVAYTDNNGVLHLQSKALVVPRDVVPAPFGAARVGVHYCHLIAPEYLKLILTGRITVPSP